MDVKTITDNRQNNRDEYLANRDPRSWYPTIPSIRQRIHVTFDMRNLDFDIQFTNDVVGREFKVDERGIWWRTVKMKERNQGWKIFAKVEKVEAVVFDE
jgi:hypothetical protein